MSNLTDFLFPKATEQQAKDGVSNSVLMTPLRTWDAVSTINKPPRYVDIETSGTWTPPRHPFVCYIEAVGGGGGGGGGSNGGNQGGSGGGSGHLATFTGEITGPISVVIGGGGAAGPIAVAGTAGGTTTVSFVEDEHPQLVASGGALGNRSTRQSGNSGDGLGIMIPLLGAGPAPSSSGAHGGSLGSTGMPPVNTTSPAGGAGGGMIGKGGAGIGGDGQAGSVGGGGGSGGMGSSGNGRVGGPGGPGIVRIWF